MDRLLFFLLKKGAHRSPIKISTTSLGNEIGMSQQNVSRLLKLLENSGKIERKEGYILITPNGLEEIRKFYMELKHALEAKKERIELQGTITAGLGEGRYYVSKYANRIKEALGFKPFFGTLNIKLNKDSIRKRSYLTSLEPITIKGFVEKGRSFGDIFAYKCKVNGVSGAIIIPVRTHHGIDILEIISQKNLLKACNKKIGSQVRISIV